MEQDQYPLTRGLDQFVRVNLIQQVWNDTFGDLLHAAVPKDISHVVDVATATGLWLCQLGKARPEIQSLDGFDISADSFLPPHALPPKVKLDVLDASKPVPEALRGKYDVVHVRLVQVAVSDNDPSWMIEHCKGLLRPGGYLQWEEYDVNHLEVHIADDISRPSRIEGLRAELQRFSPPQWIEALPKTLEDHGMSTVAAERVREAPWHRQSNTYLVSHVVKEMADVALAKGGSADSANALRAMSSGALEEMLHGSYGSLVLQRVVARKDPGSD